MNNEEEIKKLIQEKVIPNLFFKFDENKNIIPCKGVLEWAIFFANEDRLVKDTTIGDKWISTVFLGNNMNLYGGKPLILETMVFDGKTESIYCDRYSTWKEAEEGHEKAVQWVKDGCKEDD
jgi:hypothetical protein